MTRKKAMSVIKELVFDSDIVLISGNDIYNELSDKTNTMFIETEIDAFSLVLGLSITTDRRVVLVIEDTNLLRFMGSLVQVVASKQKNIYILVISTDYYISNIKQPNLFNKIRAFKGLIFNMGFLVQDYTAYFESKSAINKLIGIYKKTIGPMISTIRVDNNRIYNKEDFESFSLTSFNDFVDFIRDSTYETTIEEPHKFVALQLNKEET